MLTLARPQTGWVITSGHAGHREPCLGIMEALGIQPENIDVTPSPIHSYLAPWGPAAKDSRVSPPWPDIVIASSRQSIPYARKVRRASGGKTFVVILQNPKLSPSNFDLVWVSEHDDYTGPNVIRTITSPHRLTDARLKSDARALRQRLKGHGAIAGPIVGVLVGGKSAKYEFSPKEFRQLGEYLRKFSEAHDLGLLITPSRRTGRQNVEILEDALDLNRSWIWDETGDNPYAGILGLAERVVVTGDSVNLIGEATFTGRPIMVYPLKGRSRKIERFIGDLEAAGIVRQFHDELADWTYERPNATPEIADEILKRYSQHTMRASK
jgi:uncharacterized protein